MMAEEEPVSEPEATPDAPADAEAVEPTAEPEVTVGEPVVGQTTGDPPVEVEVDRETAEVTVDPSSAQPVAEAEVESEPDDGAPIDTSTADSAEMAVLLERAGLLHQVDVPEGTTDEAAADYYRSVWAAHLAGQRLPLFSPDVVVPVEAAEPEAGPDDVVFTTSVASKLVVFAGSGAVQFDGYRYVTSDADEIADLDACPDCSRAG